MNDERQQGTREDSRRGLVIAVTIVVVALIAAAIAYNALAPTTSESMNLQKESASSAASAEQALVPDITVTDANGSPVSIRAFEGKPMVLNFWASTCGPCQSEMPHFQAAYEAFGEKASFLMVDIPGFNGETVERAKRYLDDNGYTFPRFFDTEGQASRAFNLTSIPRTYFIDEQGAMVAQGSGALSERALQQGLEILGVI